MKDGLSSGRCNGRRLCGWQPVQLPVGGCCKPCRHVRSLPRQGAQGGSRRELHCWRRANRKQLRPDAPCHRCSSALTAATGCSLRTRQRSVRRSRIRRCRCRCPACSTTSSTMCAGKRQHPVSVFTSSRKTPDGSSLYLLKVSSGPQAARTRSCGPGNDPDPARRLP